MPYNCQCCERHNQTNIHVCLAQLDRASGYGPEGRGFESSSARTKKCYSCSTSFFCFPIYLSPLHICIEFLIHKKQVQKKHSNALCTLLYFSNLFYTLATPLLIAASAVAFATASFTLLSNAIGRI